MKDWNGCAGPAQVSRDGVPRSEPIEHGATKRELFEAGQSAAVPGGGITLGLWMQILTQFDREGAFKNG